MADETITLVWAFQPLDELQGRTGLIECEEALAQRLITEELAQDPRIGSNHFREIVPASEQPAATPAEQAYKTRVMQAEQQQAREREAEAPRKSRGRPRQNTRGR